LPQGAFDDLSHDRGVVDDEGFYRHKAVLFSIRKKRRTGLLCI
jgi:hypothetical protein